jgi:hypothetical protein
LHEEDMAGSGHGDSGYGICQFAGVVATECRRNAFSGDRASVALISKDRVIPLCTSQEMKSALIRANPR